MTPEINALPGAAQPGIAARALQTLVAACALVSTAIFPAACDWMAGEPEARARDFIESLIIPPKISAPHPDGTGKHALNAGTVAPEARETVDLMQGLATHITVEYLRAKQMQGTDFRFGYRGMRRPAENQRIVTILVSGSTTVPDASDDAEEQFRFQVRLRREPRGWRVIGVKTDR